MFQMKELVWELGRKGREGEERTVLFLTDMHINASTTSTTQDVTDYMANRTIHFEKEGIFHQERYLEEVSDYARKIGLDFIILGGDIIDCPSPENIAFLQERLEEIETPLCFALGNHDWNYSWDYLTEQSKNCYVPRIEEATNQEMDGFLIEKFGIQFLMVDSSSNRISVHALTKLMECDRLKPICVSMHVPFTTDSLRHLSVQKWGFETTMGGKGLPMDETTQAFYHQLTQFSDALLLCGHVHEFADDLLDQNLRQIVAAAGCEGNGVLLHLKG